MQTKFGMRNKNPKDLISIIRSESFRLSLSLPLNFVPCLREREGGGAMVL